MTSRSEKPMLSVTEDLQTETVRWLQAINSKLSLKTDPAAENNAETKTSRR
jgi:hypothetical protein